MESFLFQASIYLGAAVLAVPLAARLGLGSVLGYLAAGIVIGPMFGLVGNEAEDIRHFAEFGVVIMLFLIGLELDPAALWNMRKRLIGLGGLQIALTTTAIMALAMALGLDWATALGVGLILAPSSTAIVLQTLSEKGLMQTAGGRASFSVLLAQDIAVIPILALIPLLAKSTPFILPAGSEPAATKAFSLVNGLPGWGVTLVTLAAVGVVILAGTYLIRPLFRYIHQARLREMYTALALLLVVSIAVLMGMVGLSPALGTFLAGVVLANSEFRHELESDLAPFKGLLLGLFFITVGAGINFSVLLSEPLQVIGLTVALMAAKGAVLFVLTLVFHLPGRDRWLFALGLAQAGEFGFVLVSFSLQQGVFGPDLSETILLVIALSMLITPLLFIVYDMLSHRISAGPEPEPDDINETGAVIIAGVGRFGQVVNRMVRGAGFSTVVLDHDLETIETMRRFGVRGFFGDPSRPEILRAAGLASAQVLVVALDDRASALTLVAYARKERPDLHIVARAYDRVHVYELYQAGANDIVRELFDGSLRAGRYVLENMGLTEFEAAEAQTSFYHADRAAVRELAALWKPGVPVTANPAYVEKAKELNKDLETALVGRLKPGQTLPEGSLPDPAAKTGT